jgi:hypothetical protein
VAPRRDHLCLGAVLVDGLVDHVGADGDHADDDEGAGTEAAAVGGLQGAVGGGDGGFGLGVGLLMMRKMYVLAMKDL